MTDVQGPSSHEKKFNANAKAVEAGYKFNQVEGQVRGELGDQFVKAQLKDGARVAEGKKAAASFNQVESKLSGEKGDLAKQFREAQKKVLKEGGENVDDADISIAA